MTLRKLSKFSALAIIIGGICPMLFGKDPLPDTPVPAAVQPVTAIISTSPKSADQHKFWDRENIVLFSASAALSGADFAITRSNLQNGGRELNPMVRIFGRSTAGLAANFAGEGIGTVAISYLFHKTGHHRMERMITFLNIGGSAGAVGYGLAHH